MPKVNPGCRGFQQRALCQVETELHKATSAYLDGVEGGLLSRRGRPGRTLLGRALLLPLYLAVHVLHQLDQDAMQILFIRQPGQRQACASSHACWLPLSAMWASEIIRARLYIQR